MPSAVRLRAIKWEDHHKGTPQWIRCGICAQRNSLRTPLATCRVQKIVPLENGARLTMTCTNSMSTGQVATTLRFGRAGMLERVGDGDTAVA